LDRVVEPGMTAPVKELEAMIVRPSLKAQLFFGWTWIVLGAGVGAVVGAVAGADGTSQPTAVTVGIVSGTVIAIAGAIWTARRIEFIVREWGLEARNVFSSWRAPWAQIAEVGVRYVGRPAGFGTALPSYFQGQTPPAIGCRLRDGRSLSGAKATALLPLDRRDEVIEVLRRLASEHGFVVSVEPADLRTSWY
jgi:hypothetical protein